MKYTKAAIKHGAHSGFKHPEDRRGVCVGHNYLGGCVVRWDGARTTASYHPAYIERA